MCRFASAVFNPKTMEVRVADLSSHSETYKKLGLADGPKPNQWREMHYTSDGEVECRVLDVDSRTAPECVEAITARWPSFVQFISWAINNPESVGGYLDLGGLTSAEGLKLPESVGGGLYLRGLTSAEGLKLPESVGGYLDLSGLTSAEGLKLPESVGDYLDLGGRYYAVSHGKIVE